MNVYFSTILLQNTKTNSLKQVCYSSYIFDVVWPKGNGKERMLGPILLRGTIFIWPYSIFDVLFCKSLLLKRMKKT